MKISKKIKFGHLSTRFLIVFFLSVILTPCLTAQTYKIGVLAKRGPVKTIEKWKATADYLTETIPGMEFTIIPLDFNRIYQAVKNDSVHFVLANSAIYIEMQKTYGIKAVLTMINSRQGKPLNTFGGVIFVKADNASINSLNDLKGKKFAAVKKNSFGGWHMAYRLLKSEGIDPFSDFSKMVFAGTHDRVVLAVFRGGMDGGTVRTDTLERMDAEGKINMADFKIIHLNQDKEFPFVFSTRLYPEWPLAQTKNTPEEVVAVLSKALMSLKSDSAAAKAAKITGWREAMNYSSVDACLKEIGAGPYQ
jgi:twitching motility protein PilJ